ncbi:MAG: hypothetical protein IJS84_09215 [Spirochaetales bacterium]|nr:hypothetical protein [Spirochaetales bacterium]
MLYRNRICSAPARSDAGAQLRQSSPSWQRPLLKAGMPVLLSFPFAGQPITPFLPETDVNDVDCLSESCMFRRHTTSRRNNLMRGYEEYMTKYPSVARRRAERFMADGSCLFLKEDSQDYALLPENGFMDRLVYANLRAETCECNVYRTKHACPHIAAGLGIVEKNGGIVPYTDPVAHVHDCLTRLKGCPSGSIEFYKGLFTRDISPFLRILPKEEKAKFALELGEYLEQKNSPLSSSDFQEYFDDMGYRKDASRSLMLRELFNNRQKCMKAVVALLRSDYLGTFSESQKKVIVTEIAANNTLARKLLPELPSTYYPYFSREQLLYFFMHNLKQIPPFQLENFMPCLLNEEPPLYEDYLKLYNSYDDSQYLKVDLTVPERLQKAGYGDKLGKMVENIVNGMNGLADYSRIIKVFSHEQFLAAWKKREENKHHSWYYTTKDWEIAVSFLEDPEADPDDYYLDRLDCSVLQIIQKTRPAYVDEVNKAARKIYRAAAKANHRSLMLEALMVLVHGRDPIAIKYASSWDRSKGSKDELLYLIAVGMHFDCLDTVVPDIKELEAPHAAGQTE